MNIKVYVPGEILLLSLQSLETEESYLCMLKIMTSNGIVHILKN